MLIEKNLKEFMDELASSSPAPGGGSVAALCGALGASLLSMVCNLTLGKEGYENVQEEIKQTLEKTETLRKGLSELIDKDTEAFNKVMAAFKLPKENRAEQLQDAFKEASSVPMETARKSLELLELAKVIAEKGNKNSITDAGAGGKLAKTAIDTAALNVRINLGSIKDENFKAETENELKQTEASSENLIQEIMQIVNSKI